MSLPPSPPPGPEGPSYPYVSPRPRSRPAPPPESPPAPSIPPPSVTAEETPGYDVGYKRPPVAGQFRKGQSGNPNGRPKGAEGLKTLVRKLSSEKVTIRSNGQVRQVRKIEAMLQKIIEQAFSGNMRALQSFVTLYQAAVPDDPVEASKLVALPTAESLDQHDQAILDELRATMRREIGDLS